MVSLKLSKPRLAIFTIYIVLLCIAVTKHEPWFDEAQAWLLARDSSLPDLLFKYMRYEGSPALWHMLLAIPARLQLPYISLNIISGILAATGTYLFLRYSPFPAAVILLYPFSYFAFYQYGVIARSYVLFPLLLFSAAVVYKNKQKNPYPYIFLLCLLANVSLHGFIIAAGLVFVHFLDLILHYRELKQRDFFKQFAAFAAFGTLTLFLFFQLKPAPDLISFAAYTKDMNYFFNRSMIMFQEALSASGSYKSIFISLSYGLSVLAIVTTLFWLQLRKKLLTFLVPFVGLGLLFTIIYANIWHQGTIFYTWLFVLWISFENMPMKNKWVKNTSRLITWILVLVLAVQVVWSYNAFTFDFRHSYSASREISAYIKENHLEKKKIYMTSFHSVSILPYFKENIFCNFNQKKKPCFWFWSRKNTMYTEPYLAIQAYDPDLIILGIKEYCTGSTFIDDSPLPSIPGYKVRKEFRGSLFWKDKPYETDSFVLFEKVDRMIQD